jgi:general stress protein 26
LFKYSKTQDKKMIINTDCSPADVIDNVRTDFQKAASDTNHGLRFFSVATFDLNNNAPESRMVVLRKFLPDWTIRFYTDYRSTKVTRIQNHPSVSLLFWNAQDRYQIRVKAEARVHYQNEVTESEWQNVDTEGKKAYTTILAPGSAISGPAEARNRESNSHHFCVVDALPLQIKVLQLNRMDHFAMNFVRESSARNWRGTWIVP